jgi:ubiquitin carboxyl-terminal hydrolase 5/13
LNVSLHTFYGFCLDHSKLYHQKTGDNVFLNIKRIKKENPEAAEKKPTRLAIGVEGGFNDENKYNYEDLLSLVCFDPINEVIPLPNNDIPEKIKMSVDAIIGAQSASTKDQLAVWEGDQVKPTKYAESLKQMNPDNIKIPKTGYTCGKCDLSANVWLCLTCGFIGCGRRNYDGTGGNNHMVEHHNATGHPLVVKLGTITPDGKADVYSYYEDEMVNDPLLVQHLEFFGINISEMQKTDKTMAELTLDYNINFDAHRIQESGEDLYGPHYTGLKNLGNSCYLASVTQTLFNIPEFQNRYFDLSNKAFAQSNKDPSEDLDVQMTKLANGLLSGKYSQIKMVTVKHHDKQSGEEILKEQPAEQEGIPPRMFKSLVGKGHPEFSTARQQDALEFYQHLITLIERNEATKGSHHDPTQFLKFMYEDRIQCMSSKKVKYTRRPDNVLNLPVPLDKALNKEEYEAFEKKQKAKKEQEKKQKEEFGKAAEGSVIQEIDLQITANEISSKDRPKEEIVRPRVPMIECFKAFAEPEMIAGFYSSAIKQKTSALKTTSLVNFPDYLVVAVRRFTLDGWVPKKLDVFIENAQEIDISFLRAKGKQPNEELLPEESAAPEQEQPKLNIDESIVQQLELMGFPRIRCQKGVLNTNNAGAEEAMNWILEHSEDPDIDAPLPTPSAQKSTPASTASEENIQIVMSMGLDRDQAALALKNCNNNVERAIEWIFSHQDEMATLLAQDKAQSQQPAEAPKPKQEEKLTDGAGKYELIGFISHIGSSTTCGHYVCHLKKEGKWTIFNDRKVSLCDNPHFFMG